MRLEKRRTYFRRTAFVGAIILAAASAIVVNRSANAADWSNDAVLQGSATLTPSGIQLTDAEKNQAGAAWIAPAPDIRKDIHVSFAAVLEGGDGVAFVLQADTRGDLSLGGGGGGLGYYGITPSLAVEFDLHNNFERPGDEHAVGILADGDVATHLAAADPPFPLRGGLFYAWIDYTVEDHILSVSLAQSQVRPTAPLLTYQVDVPMRLGGDQVSWGFTGGTGSASGIQTITDWQNKPILTAPTASDRIVPVNKKGYNAAFELQWSGTGSDVQYTVQLSHALDDSHFDKGLLTTTDWWTAETGTDFGSTYGLKQRIAAGRLGFRERLRWRIVASSGVERVVGRSGILQIGGEGDPWPSAVSVLDAGWPFPPLAAGGNVISPETKELGTGGLLAVDPGGTYYVLTNKHVTGGKIGSPIYRVTDVDRDGFPDYTSLIGSVAIASKKIDVAAIKVGAWLGVPSALLMVQRADGSRHSYRVVGVISIEEVVRVSSPVCLAGMTSTERCASARRVKAGDTGQYIEVNAGVQGGTSGSAAYVINAAGDVRILGISSASDGRRTRVLAIADALSGLGGRLALVTE